MELIFTTASPAFIAAAVTRSVVRWRTARVVAEIPRLVEGIPDVVARAPSEAAAGVRYVTELIAQPLARLVQGGRPPAAVAAWAPPCLALLLSAASGGQWPQTRLRQLGSFDSEDSSCQLCHAAAGTLAHRRCCRREDGPSCRGRMRAG